MINITNLAEKKVIIKIRGYIGMPEWWQFDDDKQAEYTATKEKMESDIKAITEIKATGINVDIDSFGGSVDHAFNIYNALKATNIEVKVVYSGWSASAATIIAAAGTSIKAAENMFLLYHEARTSGGGTANEFKSRLNTLVKTNDLLVKHYVNQGSVEADVIELIGRNNGEGEWITAAEAKEFGLITEVDKTYSAAANYETKEYGLPNIINNHKQSNKMTENEKTSFFEEMKTKLMSAFKKENPEAKAEFKILDHADVVAKFDELTAETKNETALKVTALEEVETLKANARTATDSIASLNVEKESIQAQLTESNNTIEALKSGKTTVEQLNDPTNIDGNKPKLTANEQAAAANAAALDLV